MVTETLSLHRAKVSKIDLDWLTPRLMQREHLSAPQATEAVDLYRKFLEIVADNPDSDLVPPGLADKAWHHHILETRRYVADCEYLFGGYMHHDPNVYGTATYWSAWDRTRGEFRRRFGVALPHRPATAGPEWPDDENFPDCMRVGRNVA